MEEILKDARRDLAGGDDIRGKSSTAFYDHTRTVDWIWSGNKGGRGDIAHVDFAIAVDVAHGIGIGAAAEDFVDQGGNIAHVHFTIAIDVARGL